jgi:GxxExxY protein
LRRVERTAYSIEHAGRFERFSQQTRTSIVGFAYAMEEAMELLHRALTESIIGVYHRAHHELGSGFLEKIPQAAMVIALREAGLPAAERVPFPVYFRGHLLGDFYADIVVNGLVLVEIKSKAAIHPHDEAQAINYLRASTLEVALILNFGPKREYLRRVLTNDRKNNRVSAQLPPAATTCCESPSAPSGADVDRDESDLREFRDP